MNRNGVKRWALKSRRNAWLINWTFGHYFPLLPYPSPLQNHFKPHTTTDQLPSQKPTNTIKKTWQKTRHGSLRGKKTNTRDRKWRHRQRVANNINKKQRQHSKNVVKKAERRVQKTRMCQRQKTMIMIMRKRWRWWWWTKDAKGKGLKKGGIRARRGKIGGRGVKGQVESFYKNNS